MNAKQVPDRDVCLFILNIAELIDMLDELGCYGIYVNEDAKNIMILLYADDMALIADTIGRLQRMIDVLESYCCKWNMLVNLIKAKIMVFRRGDVLRKNEQWFYDGEKIEVVYRYKYLGIFFSTKLKWSLAKQTLATQAQKAILCLKRKQYKCGLLPVNVAIELFDKQILPILIYGSEIWGYEFSQALKNVQTSFLKKLIGVNKSTSNCAVLGECGRLPLAVYYMTNCIKYWIKLIKMPDARYPKACYNMLKAYGDRGKVTWTTHIRALLAKYGFRYVWMSQEIGDDVLFIEIFKRRLVDCYTQNWNSDVHDNDKLLYYKEYKERLCMNCNLRVIEDEYHVILICIKYLDLRILFILPKYYIQPSLERFCQLMNNKITDVICKLAAFVHHVNTETVST